jgi:diguanylate cyclase
LKIIDFCAIILLFLITLITYYAANSIVFILIQIFICITICIYTYVLKNNARIDKLTSLYNRKYFDYILSDKLKRLRSRANLALLICDIDNFKLINDTYGHVTGDAVLAELADILKANIRKSEEFAIIMPNTNCNEAEVVAMRIKKAVEKHYFKTNVTVTVSVGVAVTDYKVSAVDIVIKADKALYIAKKQKNTVVCLQM